MLLMIFFALLLLLILVFMPGYYLTEQVGPHAQMGPRDDLPEPSQALGRARRALANLQETLPIFFVLALLAIIFGEEGWLALAGAGLFLLGRIGHVVCYMGGISPWRSISFTIGLFGLLLMALPLLPHIWS
ncbi:MAPEG family protein [Devosia beringensis]|uniref:MAPEG family protein n=1 Tax=Devosia beringensis TaxID=2657486 RepID=UPI00186B79CB|nr:MAPEG family protein [Devosia beringensis]